jgi:pimeloyl-[acyl-carrier protein] methyl ester esterase
VNDLVLLHGWGFDATVWDDLVPRLSMRWKVRALDLPGHGHARSSSAEALGFDDAVDALASQVAPGSTIVGWSLGGLFAQRLALRHRAKVERLVLVGSSPCFVQREDWPDALELRVLRWFGRDLEADPGGTLERFVRLNAMNAPGARDAIRRFIRKLRASALPAPETLRTGLAWLEGTDLRGSARELRLPMLLVHGARDAIAPVGAARWLASRAPRAHLAEWPDAAHMPFFSHPDRFVDALEAWHG